MAVAVGVAVAAAVAVAVAVAEGVGVGDGVGAHPRKKTDTWDELRLPTTTSCLPSPLKSPTATA